MFGPEKITSKRRGLHGTTAWPTWRLSNSTTGPSAVPTRPRSDSGLQLNPSKFEYIAAKPLPPSVHPTEVPVVLTVPHDMCCWEPPSVPQLRNSWPNSSVSSPRPLPSFFFDSTLDGVKLPRAHDASRQPPPLCEEDADLPHEVLGRHLTIHGAGVHRERRVPHQGDISRVMAQVSIGKGGFGIRDPVLHSAATFLASSSSTEAFCSSLWDSYSTTPDPDVVAARVQCQHTIHDDVAWHPGSTAHSQSFFCLIHTLDTLTEQATQGDWISLDLHHVPGAGAWQMGGPASSLFGILFSCGRSCNTACASQSSPMTRITLVRPCPKHLRPRSGLPMRSRPQPQTQRDGPRLL